MTEQDLILAVFTHMLRAATEDGGRKRAAGQKLPWWIDSSHKAAVFSHLCKREKGEMRDSDSNSHPYVHAAWRLLAIAYQETHGKVKPSAADYDEPRRGKLDEARGCGTDLER